MEGCSCCRLRVLSKTRYRSHRRSADEGESRDRFRCDMLHSYLVSLGWPGYQSRASFCGLRLSNLAGSGPDVFISLGVACFILCTACASKVAGIWRWTLARRASVRWKAGRDTWAAIPNPDNISKHRTRARRPSAISCLWTDRKAELQTAKRMPFQKASLPREWYSKTPQLI